MSIKSDQWIRRMARDHGMIEPFEPDQVRYVKGERIVSYGTSSYGYDVRCAGEFKIFTNINSTIVDPKRFDAKSFVDLEASVCVIPPNSFALARTVEYFRIPRNVLTICLGKCVTADTRVVDAETGAYVPITELRWGSTTLAYGEDRLQPARVCAFLPQGKKPVFELRTRAGLRIRATANHPFLSARGWARLEDLRAGDRIGVARSIPTFGRTAIPDWEATLLGLMIAGGGCHSAMRGIASASADRAALGWFGDALAASGITSAGWDHPCLRDPLGGGRLVAPQLAQRWLRRYGLNVEAEARFVPQRIFTAAPHCVRLFLKALFAADGHAYRTADGVVIECHSASRRLIEDVHHLLLRFGVFGAIREHTAPGRSFAIEIVDPEHVRTFAQRVGFVPGSLAQAYLDSELQGLAQAGLRSTNEAEILAQGARRISPARAPVSDGAYGLVTASGATAVQCTPYGVTVQPAAACASQALDTPLGGPVWDVVDSIEPGGIEEVFDLSVPKFHNFVANDMIVHNSTYARCGIIVNVTPLEPEWEGHVTLEFSNTTPLPAKIYANEGVAQMLFLESDEVCSTSYADRGGKYMGQRGVTLPRT